jgi:hypothetical protein
MRSDVGGRFFGDIRAAHVPFAFTGAREGEFLGVAALGADFILANAGNPETAIVTLLETAAEDEKALYEINGQNALIANLVFAHLE